MVLNYIKQHWQGDRTQGTAFWVNVVSLLLLLKFIIAMLSIISVIDNPVISVRLWLIAIALTLLVILPWSFIGSFRSTWKHIHLFQDRTTGTWLLIALLATLIYTGNSIRHDLPGLTNMVKIAAKKDSESYSVISQGSELYLSGFLTYDSAKNVINLLKNNPEVKTVNLNLTGGHLYEARKLSKYLAQQQYSTHVDDQCHANCLITYLGGQKRTAADTAQFSFHHRHGYENGYRSDWTIIKEQEKDRLYFQARGVYEKSTYMLYYKQSNDSDLALSAADLSNYNIVNSIQ